MDIRGPERSGPFLYSAEQRKLLCCMSLRLVVWVGRLLGDLRSMSRLLLCDPRGRMGI